MLGMILISGVIGTFATYWKCKSMSLMRKIAAMIFYSFAGYCFIGMGRLIFLRTGEFYTYSSDIRILFIDILTGIIGTVLCRSIKQINNYIAFVCMAATMSLFFVYKFIVYRNINSAIYHCIIPETISVIGLIVWGEIFLLLRLLPKKIDKLSLAVAAVFDITIFICPFFETFVSNSGEFSFTFGDILIYMLLFLVTVFLVTISVLCCIHDRVYESVITVIFAFTLAAYIQGTFLNGHLSLMDGVYREWSGGFKVLNLLIWVLVIFCVFMTKRIGKNRWRDIFIFCSFAMIVMQAAGGFSIVLTKDSLETKKENEYFSTNGLYEAAEKENVIVFVLDKYDGKYMEKVLEEEPDFLAPLDGFTYFPDTVAQFSRTYPAVTYMLTNKAFFQTPLGENYSNWAFDNCSFWKDLISSGYRLYFYVDKSSYIGDSIKKQAGNYVEHGEVIKREISLKGCIRSIHSINFYRVMPYVVKDYFAYTEGSIDDLVIADKVLAEEVYEKDDAKIKVQLNNVGIRVNDDDKAFRFIHMFGAHPPYSLDRQGNRVGCSKDLEIEQYMGSMQIVYDYLDELKKLGLYKNSTIIITADHGDNFESGEILPEKVNIILFVKPKGASDEPLIYSEKFATQCDLLPTLGGETEVLYSDESGIDLMSNKIFDEGRERLHYFHVVENTVQTAVRTYKIKGSSLDFDNWIATDEYYDFHR